MTRSGGSQPVASNVAGVAGGDEGGVVPDEDGPCLSCDIVTGRREVDGGPVLETPHWHVHQDVAYPIPGQMIVACRRHVRHLDHLVGHELAELATVLGRVRAAQRSALDVEDVYYFANEDTRHHLHVWVVPRWPWMAEFGRSVESVRPALVHSRRWLGERERLDEVRRAAIALRSVLVSDGRAHGAEHPEAGR